jgi:hypothetical protein
MDLVILVPLLNESMGRGEEVMLKLSNYKYDIYLGGGGAGREV